ncbi:MAG: hypothetical protein CSB32_01030 [Desulfobacterales bacterium]|nr:MAG: hypothetical protein CSB32_01030 [Desulfobacterales bacterium]
MQIITAPSKTQQFNGRELKEYTCPETLSLSEEIVEILRGLTQDELASLMKTSDRLTDSTRQRLDSFCTPFTLDNAKQALFTFQGDAYGAIQSTSYSLDELHRAQKHINILSGLYGLLRPLDLMQPYRLEMATRLAVREHKNLYALWKDTVTALINTRLKKSQQAVLINLASEEYAKVIDKKRLEAEMITIIFQQEKSGRSRSIPIYSKRARGRMIDYFITQNVARAEDLKDFAMDGYSFIAEKSSADSWLFLTKKT